MAGSRMPRSPACSDTPLGTTMAGGSRRSSWPSSSRCSLRRCGSCVAFPAGWLGARPTNEAIHQIGLWTIRLIFIALAITPLRGVLQWQRLVLVRRMVGVAAFAYAIGASDPLHRQRGVRPRQGRQRDRAAHLPDDRVCRGARPVGAGGDLDRRHGPPARPPLADAAPAGLSDRTVGGDPLTGCSRSSRSGSRPSWPASISG